MLEAAGPKASGVPKTSIESALLCPIPVQSKADVDIRIGADVSVSRVVDGVEIVDRGDVLGLSSRQCAGSGDEDDGRARVWLWFTVFLLLRKIIGAVQVSGTSTSRQKLMPAMLIIPTIAKDNSLTRHHVFMRSNILL